MNKAYLLIGLTIFAITSCGSGGKGSSSGVFTGSSSSSSSGAVQPNTPVAFEIEDVNVSNESSYSFRFGTAQTSLTHRWAFNDSDGNSIEGSGTVTNTSTTINNVDLSSLADGNITYSVLVENSDELTSEPLTGTISKDATPPSPYTLTLPDTINESNETNITLMVSTTEDNVGAEYAFVFINPESSTEVRGQGTVSSAIFNIENIDLSPLETGAISLAFTMTDAAGNALASQENATKSSEANVITISGTVTYDHVPHLTQSSGLNYNAIEQRPARSVVVRLLDASDNALDSTRTDDQGFYSLVTPANTAVKVSVEALYAPNERPTSPSDADYTGFAIRDNTSQEALYVLEGSLSNSGTDSSTRDLHAPSGWQNNRYQGTRAAAPFAILDTVYDSYNLLIASAPDINLDGISIFWSTENQAINGSLTDGEIGTSFYSEGKIYILGSANNDTDEYDSHVIAHEFGHYVEDALSRSDSIGGQHNAGDRLDMRVALSEGWGNAYSGIVLQDPVYRDSLGSGQSLGFSFNVENNGSFQQGWYNEDSVETILYDLYDSPASDDDNVSDQFDALFSVMRSDTYINSNYLTGIHLLLTEMKSQHPNLATEIDAMAADQNFTVNDALGTGEVNNAGSADALPIYLSLTAGGSSVQACSRSDFGSYNKLNNRRFIHVTVPQTTTYTITVDAGSASPAADPDFILWSQGNRDILSESTESNRETTTRIINEGEYILEIYEYSNIEGDGRNICFDVSVN